MEARGLAPLRWYKSYICVLARKLTKVGAAASRFKIDKNGKQKAAPGTMSANAGRGWFQASWGARLRKGG